MNYLNVLGGPVDRRAGRGIYINDDTYLHFIPEINFPTYLPDAIRVETYTDTRTAVRNVFSPMIEIINPLANARPIGLPIARHVVLILANCCADGVPAFLAGNCSTRSID